MTALQGRDSDFLFGLASHRLGFCTEDQLLEAIGDLLHDPARDFEQVLNERANMSAAAMHAAQAAATAWRQTHGDATTALGALEVPKRLMEAWRGHRSNPSTAETLMVPVSRRAGPPSAAAALSVMGAGGMAPSTVMTQAPEKKYVLGGELGRGGIGRVIEAFDSELERTVALKLVLEDAPAEALERFRWEGRVTGRLEHPNIVPVHEVGVLPTTKEVFVAMKRIHGRDMLQVIRDRTWKQRRLVDAFRDVCRGMAYAHSKGVVHRDLKPANVMLGEFGEVLIVDWGLARALGTKESTRRVRPRSTTRKVRKTDAMSSRSSKLTMEGQVLGTPSYMPPEQALGRLDEVDQRSDVYALGAILYEILTLQPPFEDPNPWEVIKQVTTGEVKPPSLFMPCPPELEAICLKALSRRKEDRYASAGELAEEIDAYLEGTKERERRERLAREQVEKARAENARREALEAEARKCLQAARGLAEDTKAHAPLAKKKELWEAQDRVHALERQSLRAFAEADAALTSALSNVPDHAEARLLKAQIWWQRFLEAEAAGDERAALLHRQVVERHDDGEFLARLRGDGTLEVKARAYPCRCLDAGRKVSPEDLGIRGYHPWSGRILTMRGSEGLRELEPTEPVLLKVHGPGCRPAPIPGAKVWAFRYVEMDRALIPVTVGAGKPKCPEAVLNGLFGNSPQRPRGTGQYLGETPLAPRSWPMGSWLLVVVAEGFRAAAVPVNVGRQEQLAADVTLFAESHVPPEFLPVAAGRFPFQVGRAELSLGVTGGIRETDDFLMARSAVTCREYCEFLNALPPAEAARRVPRQSEEGGAYWPLTDRGWVVPTEEWVAGRPERAAAWRLRLAQSDWREDWPVLSICWNDAAAFAHWAAHKARRLFCLPHEEWWEKSGRGPDGRPFPWGTHFDAIRCNCSETYADGLRPAPVDEFPADESPYGIRGLSGNGREWCLNDLGGRRYRDWRVSRGGAWNAPSGSGSLLKRFGWLSTTIDPGQGFRLACAVRVTGGAPEAASGQL